MVTVNYKILQKHPCIFFESFVSDNNSKPKWDTDAAHVAMSALLVILSTPRWYPILFGM